MYILQLSTNRDGRIMKYSLTEELNKITLLAKYVSKVIEQAGLIDLNKSSADSYGRVLMSTKFYFDISHHNEEGPSLDLPSTCKSIFKQINGVNEWITHVGHKNYDSNFYYFDCRKNIHEDPAIIDFKVMLRKAIKDPSKFYNIK
tara:strand:+ start:1077 stop:1511 length:435 start_codon:yes stop_codon:yes gene_type:complete